MIDEETESLWSHLLGEAMQGPLQGETLPTIPSDMTDWKTWRHEHPETTAVVMSRKADRYRRQWYQHPERFVLGLTLGEQARAWNFKDLMQQPVVNDEIGNDWLLVVFDAKSSTALVYDRHLGGRTLTFEHRDGKLYDRETGSQWNPMTGIALTSSLKGKRLTQLPGIVSFDDAWRRFHPESTYWKDESSHKDFK